MDDNARAFARNMFRLRIHEANGQAYEDLFVGIMGHAFEDFQPVKPHGNIGDRKNDGFIPSAGAYYQVYAPEDIQKIGGDAIKKLKEDFAGLKAYWDGLYPVKEFYFVVNDKYRGAPPHIQPEIDNIKTKHSLTKAAVFLTKHLESVLFKLPSDVIVATVGHVPDIDAGEFLFLSGFTYFIGAWIEFEQSARKLIEINSAKNRPIVGGMMLRVLRDARVLTPLESQLTLILSDMRNRLVHGDSHELPDKSDIDALVLLTERLRSVQPLSAGQLPPRLMN
ncbi:hypothetical protein [Lignipirellula cremea]|uniref:Uncharacterized protein n=1 Tax=Lignipirellula cremea TaxID=2528010 RepID=A0A518E339_9BACT|nr:hypothetical protein [Lignipirellula cremea]QDU98510.1 hypothetical protein Pla8534_63790 [Lignipirellula cremea]